MTAPVDQDRIQCISALGGASIDEHYSTLQKFAVNWVNVLELALIHEQVIDENGASTALPIPPPVSLRRRCEGTSLNLTLAHDHGI
jgi:hypothetical protein